MNDPSKRKSASLMQFCLRKHRKEGSPLSMQINREMHVTTPPKPAEMNQFTTFFFAIRNPLTRVISSYSYLHHNNTQSLFAQNDSRLKENFYKVCFPTLQHFLRAVQFVSHPDDPRLLKADQSESPTKELSEYCQHMAVTVLKGRSVQIRQVNIHMRNNYKFYHDATVKLYPKKEILAVRMEHLWDDIKALDVATGGTGFFSNDGSAANNYAKKKTNSRGATSEQLRDLCCILWDDIEIFQEIVNRARNLDYPSKLEAIQDVWKTCGINSGGQSKYMVEDDRTRVSNAIAREENGEIVLFSWFKWHKEQCRNLNEGDYFKLEATPPKSITGGGMTRALRAIWSTEAS